MSGQHRVAHGGSDVQRAQPLSFEFDGRRYQGLQGDTLASALLANGVHLVGRSFKYHRPRGIMAAGPEDPNALVTVRRDAARTTPNLNAAQVEVYDGLVAGSQNRWPSLQFDAGRINDLLSRFIPSGFYYKTFMWPRQAWHAFYEPRIRAAAGLGVAPAQADPDCYAQRYAHCDVLVVGAGPAGIAAALTAAASGARVLLCDEQALPGGSLRSGSDARIDGQPAAQWLHAALRELEAAGNVTVLARTTAFGYLPHNMVALSERLTDHLAAPPASKPRERLWQVRARQVILATGAIERPLVFPGNDRPGVMLAGAARSYLNRYGVVPGARVVVLTAHDEAYRAALDLQAAGVQIAALADLRPAVDSPLAEAVRRAGIALRTGTTAIGTRGNLRISSVGLVATDGPGDGTRAPEWLHCDALLMSGGYTPSLHLHSQARGKVRWDEGLQVFVPGAGTNGCRSIGACNGLLGAELARVFEEATAAAAAAVRECGFDARPRSITVSGDQAFTGGWIGALPQPAGSAAGKAFVDWQNDVTAKDLALAVREGFRSIEHIKRYTTTGMATDQGKTSNLNALAIAAQQLGRPIPEVGLTTFRMPYHPVGFGGLAGYARGEFFAPVRKTPMYDWAAERGAVFEPVAMWQRARYFPERGEDMHQAVARECQAVRRSCGLFDASTLGKIEVVGPDAIEFMNRLYVNNWTTLAVGRCRYGILLRDDGFVYDDGVVARIAADRLHVTTTTGGAPRVLGMMEDYLQTEWPELKVWLTSTTEQWAVIAVQGPNARAVLEPLVEQADLSPAALPHMAMARGLVCGVPAMIFRVSFTGELGYEINVPADFGAEVWRAVWEAGQAHGLCAYGTEAMHVLRAEKGYIIVGQDTDGTMTPDDAGVGWAVGKNKTEFVGMVSLRKPALRDPNRKQLVGLLTADPSHVLQEGSQITALPGQRPPMKLVGHVTSSYYSAVLGRSIALAVVTGGRARIGETLYVPTPRGESAVTVTQPVFYDPKGERLNG
ncbi:MAG TPA: sarcosine oxidase subunit alpha family protein [Burkholderiaceae bacterium]|nr:sarcosine oxidase subunit alpha family protein [Burkholderiaceae bacterium]